MGDRKVVEMEKSIRIQGNYFQLVHDERNGWNPEAFRDRYSEVLDKYDYIVGDWGFGQLRLKGFYEDRNKKAAFEQRIGSLDQYIQEYCNFGCSYFVVKKMSLFLGGKKEEENLEETGEE
ncbi:YutD-like domain-containing protein [Thermicanus aegyptius]|uniref:YutD-like domain-containing protein n=1 Tax=Thermicanus aegyptius TaxID=94009 RepID=UPI00040E561B|nr:YutD family protein [Thermicanus sp.]